MRQDTKLCKDCQHYSTIFHSASSCTNKDFVKIHRYTGEPYFYSCEVARSKVGKCKEEGVGFKVQPKEFMCYGDYSFTTSFNQGVWKYNSKNSNTLYGEFSYAHEPRNQPPVMLLGKDAFPKYKPCGILEKLFRVFKSIVGK